MSGVFWGLARNWFTRLAGLAVYIFLARTLDPRDFGVVAMAGIFLAVVTLVPHSGLFQRTVQRPTADNLYLQTTFWCSLVIGLASLVLLWVLAPSIANWVGMPGVSAVLPAIGVVALLQSINVVPLAIIIRRLQYRQDAIRGGLASICSGITALGLAYAGLGVWALVGQQIVHAIMSLVLTWRFSGWQVRVAFDRGIVPDLFKVGGSMVLFQVLGMLRNQLPSFLLGIFWGAEVLGIYAIARRMFSAISDTSMAAVNRVTLSVFSRASDFRRQIDQLYPMSLFANTVLLVSPVLALALASHDLVFYVFGEKWMQATPMLAVMLVGGAFGSAGVFGAHVLLAAGKSWLAIWVRLVMLLVAVPLFLAVARLDPLWLVTASALISVVGSLFWTEANRRTLSLSLADLGPSLQSALISVICFGPLAYVQFVVAPEFEWLVFITVPSMVLLSLVMHLLFLRNQSVHLKNRMLTVIFRHSKRSGNTGSGKRPR